MIQLCIFKYGSVIRGIVNDAIIDLLLNYYYFFRRHLQQLMMTMVTVVMDHIRKWTYRDAGSTKSHIR